ncbi:nucleotidyltransferase family protein [Roseateles sp.]|jgi:hypothetical protein|uniref:nucleotidyltransferase family protein n=1 Tax=Roseateles sp. TaxID=1971397 RepID=UPI00391DAD19
MNARHPDRHDELRAIVRSSAWLMRALHAARYLGLPQWCIGAGALRNRVWDHLHGHSEPSALADVDLAYFDPEEPSGEEAAHQAALARACPDLPWELTNQAHVHLWFESCFGHAVAPLRSLQDAVASWPEFATAVAVRLEADDTLTVIAPHGLDDLFAMRIRRNPARVSVETFRQRIAQKQYAQRWPRVLIEDAVPDEARVHVE